MPTRKYLQFYLLNDGDNNVNFGNGFSSTWNIVNPEWIEIIDSTCKPDKVGNILIRPSVLFKDMEIPKLPEADEVWISAVFLAQMQIVAAWVSKNPKVKFIVGGPAISSKFLDMRYSIPNLELKYGTVEEALGIEQDSKNWNMEIPDNLVKDGKDWIYSISNGMGCWWSKCKFCSSYNTKPHIRKFDPEITYRAPDGAIWLGSDAYRESEIPLLADINYEGPRNYTLYLCCTTGEYHAFKKLFSQIGDRAKKLHAKIGMEMPSNRMRTILGKPSTKEEMSRIINLFNDYGAVISFHGIFALPNMVDEDIAEAKWFFDSISNCTNISGFGMRPLELFGNELFPEVSVRVKQFSRSVSSKVVNLTPEDIDKNLKYLHLLADFVNSKEGMRLVFRREGGPIDQLIESLIR